MKLATVLWLFSATAVFLTAASLSRAYVATSNTVLVVTSMALFVVGNLIMLKVMREGGLGIAISLSAVSQLILINIVAFLFFGERLTGLQLAGVAFGVLAMGLMLTPAAARG